MAMQEATGLCKRCDCQTLIRRQGTNHILHLIITVVTCGLWLIVWVLASVKIGGWRCSTCGGGVSRKMFS